LILLMTSDPGTGASVAPFGGLTPLYTPNPIAAGIPTSGQPILLDVSMSTTTNGMSMRLFKEGLKLPGSWLLDAEGLPSDDPAVLFGDPPGTILPLGGVDLGHKGFALGLLVEALTCGLGGWGRAEADKRWGAAVFLQLLDPGALGGAEKFMKETTFLARACQESEPKDPGRPVRLPGQAGLARKKAALEEGLTLHPAIMPPLEEWAERLGVNLPQAL
jgi:L-lactate dehydrogenase